MTEERQPADQTEAELAEALRKSESSGDTTTNSDNESVIVQQGFEDETRGAASSPDDDEQDETLAEYLLGSFVQRLDMGVSTLENSVQSVKQQASSLVHGAVANLESFLEENDNLLPGGIPEHLQDRLALLADDGSREVEDALFGCASSLAAQTGRNSLIPFGANLSVVAATGSYDEHDVRVAVGKSGDAQTMVGETVFPATATNRLLSELLESGNLELNDITVEVASMDEESEYAPFQIMAEGADNCSSLLALAVKNPLSFAEQTSKLDSAVESARARLAAAELSLFPMALNTVHHVSGTVQARKEDETEGGWWITQVAFHGDSATVVMAGFDEDGQQLDDDQEEQCIGVLQAAKLISDCRNSGWKLRIMENSERRQKGVLDNKECQTLVVLFSGKDEPTLFTSVKDFVKEVRETVAAALQDSLPATVEELAGIRDNINNLIADFGESDYGADLKQFLEADDWEQAPKKRDKKAKKNKKGKKAKKGGGELTAEERVLVAHSKLPPAATKPLLLAKRRLNPQQ